MGMPWYLFIPVAILALALIVVAWAFIGFLVASTVFRVFGYKADWHDDDAGVIFGLVVLWPLVITVGLLGYLFYVATSRFFRWGVNYIKTTTDPQPDYGE